MKVGLDMLSMFIEKYICKYRKKVYFCKKYQWQ